MTYQQFHEQWRGTEHYIRNIILNGLRKQAFASYAIRHDLMNQHIDYIIKENNNARFKLESWTEGDEDKYESIKGVIDRIERVNRPLLAIRNGGLRNNPELNRYFSDDRKTISKKRSVKDSNQKTSKNSTYKACNGF